jgi:aspartate/methionine/tyrosine aminotransferase
MNMFASRTNWTLAPNRLSRHLEERRGLGLSFLDLTESNPTRCGFCFDQPAILEALGDPHSLVYEPEPRGLLRARQAVVNYYAERGADVGPKQIFLTTSTSEAYSYVFRLLADPGDAILAPRPSYPLFDFLTRLNDVELIHYPLVYRPLLDDQGWRIDLPALESTLRSSTRRMRAILAVHPNNPTGSFVRPPELDSLLDLCRSHRLALITDEVFSDYLLPARPAAATKVAASDEWRVARPASHAAASRALTFTLSGLSKISALPQMKLAWMVVNGPPDDLAAALARLEVIADTYLAVSTPLQHALPKLLELRRQMQPQILTRLRQNLVWLDDRFSSGSPVSRLRSEGGWYVILRLPSVKSDEDWAIELLDRAGVLVHPGHFYDFTSEGHLVVSLLPTREVFQEGLEKILAYVEQSA